MPILVFLGLSVLHLGPMYATDRRQTSDAHHRLMPPTLGTGATNCGVSLYNIIKYGKYFNAWQTFDVLLAVGVNEVAVSYR